MMSEEKKNVVTYEYDTDHGKVSLTPEIVAKYLVSGDGRITTGELTMFLNLCKYQRLNPFLREAYLIKYNDSDPATIVVGKDVHVKRAAKHPQFDGMESGVVVDRKGEIVESAGSLTLSGDKIIGGWAVGHRKDWGTPRKITVSWEEYAGRKRNGELNRSWSKMPGTMMVKVAEAQCLRAMFPEELQALYNAEEMGKEPGELSQRPIPTGADKTVDEIRREIQQLLEDNGALLECEYVEGISAEAFATEDRFELVNILDDLQAVIKSNSGKEMRDLTKEGFKKASEMYAEKQSTAPYEPEPDIPDNQLEIF